MRTRTDRADAPEASTEALVSRHPGAVAAADRLAGTLEGAHNEALRHLRADPPDHLEAVAWLSAHLAVAERVLHPVMRRQPSFGRAAAARLDRHNHDLRVALRMLERAASGEALGSHLDKVRVEQRVMRLLDVHSIDEHRLVERLGATLTRAEIEGIVEQYEHFLPTAPTRPHPHAPRRGPLTWLAYRLDAGVDHALDVMDARGRSLPRPRSAPAPVTKWGQYFLGEMSPTAPEDESPNPAEPGA